MRLRRSWTVRGARSKNRAMQSGAHLEVAAGLALLIDQLCDIGEGRIANMDAAGIDVQVLSLTAPGVEQLDAAETVAFARVTNDTLAEAVHRHPNRLAGFAALPTAEPDAAADELRHTVAVHGFGLIQVGHRDVGTFLGQPDGTGPADTVPSTGDYHRSAGEASKLSLLHEWSLPLVGLEASVPHMIRQTVVCDRGRH
jgi:predicted TIM-barrel fold metal-dependent hydrolase